MNATQMARTQAALAAMIEGKLLFKQEKRYGQIVDSYIFQVPGSPEYCVLTLVSYKRVQTIECEFPMAELLLRELAGGGKYQDYKEIGLSCSDARRVLAMFGHWVMINNLRHGNEALPEPDPDEPASGSVQYACA